MARGFLSWSFCVQGGAFPLADLIVIITVVIFSSYSQCMYIVIIVIQVVSYNSV